MARSSVSSAVGSVIAVCSGTATRAFRLRELFFLLQEFETGGDRLLVRGSKLCSSTVTVSSSSQLPLPLLRAELLRDFGRRLLSVIGDSSAEEKPSPSDCTKMRSSSVLACRKWCASFLGESCLLRSSGALASSMLRCCYVATALLPACAAIMTLQACVSSAKSTFTVSWRHARCAFAVMQSMRDLSDWGDEVPQPNLDASMSSIRDPDTVGALLNDMAQLRSLYRSQGDEVHSLKQVLAVQTDKLDSAQSELSELQSQLSFVLQGLPQGLQAAPSAAT
eukprot:7476-Heterococcus_DN1.PRE.1